MVEFPFVAGDRKGCVASEKFYLRWQDLRTLILCHQTAHPTQDLNGKLAHPPQASTRGRMSLQNRDSAGQKGLEVSAADAEDGAFPAIFHKLRSTEAGFWFRARRVPTSPSPTVTTSEARTTAAALPACQTKLKVISRVTIR